MKEELIRQDIPGARTFSSFFIMFLLLIAGSGFFLAGISSYFHSNFLFLTETTEIQFLPQGIVMLFYGTGAIGLGIYLFFTILWNIGSGYNEFSKEQNLVRIVRLGFPGKNRTLFLSYELKNIQKLKLLIQQGLNPRCNILLILKDKREIPLFPAQFLLNPNETERKAIQLSNFLNIPLENLII